MKLLLTVFLLFSMAIPASAQEIQAPIPPESVRSQLPEEGASFADGLWQLLQDALHAVHPDLAEAGRVSLAVISAVMMVSVLQTFSGSVKTTAEFAGTAAIAAVMLLNTNSMIQLAADVIREISEYGKLLLPVMTTAMAAQGGITSSAALYAGTALFNTFLGTLLANVLVPMVYLFLALAVGSSAAGEELLKKMCASVKNFLSWWLKMLLTLFTTYISITGVVSGTTDAATLKAAKVTISSVVPVVGGILSDASEAVLVSTGLMKNAAGIYGIFAVLALFLQPFLRIGVHYLMLKATAAFCDIFGTKRLSELIGNFSGAMGLLLAMTGSSCLLMLISTVCFMKGVG